MSTIEEVIEVDVPVTTAYNQWTQFEEFPQFMEGVEQITQITDTRNHWVTEIAGVEREFDTEIVEQVPDQRIAWRTIDGPTQAGIVSFQPVDTTRTKVKLQMEIDPDGIVEQAGDKLGLVGRRAKGDMERFKQFIESRGSETGGWRGQI